MALRWFSGGRYCAKSIAVWSACSARLGQPVPGANFLALSMLGRHIWMMLVFYRYTFSRWSPGDPTSPYWINMGAMAIDARGVAAHPTRPTHRSCCGAVVPEGSRCSTGPQEPGGSRMLLLLALWRRVYWRFPLRYDPLYWGAVFPLGMYAASNGAHDRAAMESDSSMPFRAFSRDRGGGLRRAAFRAGFGVRCRAVGTRCRR